MKRKLSILILLLISVTIDISWAQNSESDKMNKKVQQCIQKEAEIQDVLEQDFDLFDWAKQLQEYCAEVVDKKNSDVLFEIADQKEILDALVVLGQSCSTMSHIQKNLEKLQKMYAKRIKSTQNEHEGVLSHQGEREVSLTVHDARMMKIHVNSIVNSMQGDNSIFKVFR